MNDPRRSEHTRSAQEWTEETQRIRQPYPQDVDPAYSGQSPYPPPYYLGSSPNRTRLRRQPDDVYSRRLAM